MCSECEKYHKRSQRYSRHQVVNIKDASKERLDSSANRYCQQHDELLKYYCENCKINVCNDCQLSKSHQGHKISLSSEVQKSVKDSLALKITEAEKVKTILDGHVECGKKFKKEIEDEDEKSIKLV